MLLTPAQRIVCELLEEWDVLLEDWTARIPNLIKKFPKLELTPERVKELGDFDPTQNKKYVPWILKQLDTRKMRDDHATLDALRDNLRRFERLLVIPAFDQSRDIYTYDWPSLDRMIKDTEALQSRGEVVRRAKEAKKHKEVAEYGHKAGVTEVGELGDLTLLRITDPVSLSWWAWQAYKQENPNWGKPTVHPPPPGQEVSIRDGLWCVRKPTMGEGYIRDENILKAFYLVLKGGWPYVGILFEGGQVKDLDNHKVSMGVAEEIYPLVSPVISNFKERGGAFSSESRIFDNMRFARGEIVPGETFADTVDLTGSSIKALPPNLVFRESLKISRTQITEIPPGTIIHGDLIAEETPITQITSGVKVDGGITLSRSKIMKLPDNMKLGTLNVSDTQLPALPNGLQVDHLYIEGTPITKLPEDLVVNKKMHWSDPLPIAEVKMQFFRANKPVLFADWSADPPQQKLSKPALERKWKTYQKGLLKFFMSSQEVESQALHVYPYVKMNERKPQEEAVQADKPDVAAVKHLASGAIGTGYNHTDAMESLVTKMNERGIWKFSFDELETMSDRKRNRIWNQVEPGFLLSSGKFISQKESEKTYGVTHGEEL